MASKHPDDTLCLECSLNDRVDGRGGVMLAVSAPPGTKRTL